MEAVLPGSSAHLLRFTKSGSLHRATPRSPQDSLSYNPYSLAEHDPNVSNGSPHNSDGTPWQDMAPGSTAEPLNYMEPVASIAQQWHAAGRTQSDSCEPLGSQSELGRTSPQVVAPLSRSVDAKPQMSRGRQTPTRSTISHSSRAAEQPVKQLARSNTERQATDHHLYELDAGNFVPPSRPPQPDHAPPIPKPRAKNTLPPRKQLSGTLPESQAKQRSDSLEGTEPRYASRPQSQTGLTQKEAEFEYPEHLPELAPKEVAMSAGSNTSKQCKPPVTPRKAKAVKVPEYLTLSVDSDSDLKTSTEGASVQSGFSEDVLKNFTPDQLNVLINMLQQVQPAALAPNTSQAGDGKDTMKKSFGKFVDLCMLIEFEIMCVLQKGQSASHLNLKLIKCEFTASQL